MDIIDKLTSVGVAPAIDSSSIAYSSHIRNNAHPFQIRRQLISRGKILPLVSCLMVTRGDRWTIKYALECYKRQTYENRELVIVVNKNNYETISALVDASTISGTVIFGVDHDLTLGDCRNMSVARARGEILMQWDDDDLYDPLRIAVSVSALTKTTSAAALFERWLVWWPSRGLAAISGRRVWEGSIAVWREHIPVYPGWVRGEDTYITECISNSCEITTIDAPLIYVYVVTDGNTFNLEHHEKIITQASYIARNEEYGNLIELLSERIPISEYQSEMIGRS